VNRWGRFQNVDEGAHYEFICRRAGVAVEYCAEGFRNDGSLVSMLIKSAKRSMAAEHSRELSAKITRAQIRLATMGFHCGGTPGFGLRRMLVDRDRQPKVMMQHGDQKQLQSGHVILVAGPANGVRIVREIFRMFVEDHISVGQITQVLNERGIRNERGNRWSGENIGGLLRSEKYIGNLNYNRSSIRLQTRRVVNPKQNWVRVEGVMDPIVDPQVFAAAQKRFGNEHRLTDNDLLNHLTAVLCVRGHLSCQNMKAVPHTPVPNTYVDRFGSLTNAYRLLGYKPTRNYRYAKCNSVLRRVDQKLMGILIAAVDQGGGSVRIEPGHLQINGSISVSTALLPYTNREGRRAGWWLFFDRLASSKLILIVRMAQTDDEILDFHLLPFPSLCGPTFRFTETNIATLKEYRLAAASDFYRACQQLMSTQA
jgi:hypothetical protein